MQKELKTIYLMPCPFCGRFPNFYGCEGYWLMECREDCGMGPHRITKQGAVLAWNKRFTRKKKLRKIKLDKNLTNL